MTIRSALTELGFVSGDHDTDVRAALEALQDERDRHQKLLMYAYFYDDKPHQFWNQCRIQAEQDGLSDSVEQFAKWYEKRPFELGYSERRLLAAIDAIADGVIEMDSAPGYLDVFVNGSLMNESSESMQDLLIRAVARAESAGWVRK